MNTISSIVMAVVLQLLGVQVQEHQKTILKATTISIQQKNKLKLVSEDCIAVYNQTNTNINVNRTDEN